MKWNGKELEWALSPYQTFFVLPLECHSLKQSMSDAINILFWHLYAINDIDKIYIIVHIEALWYNNNNNH